jgi:hypothetical protein
MKKLIILTGISSIILISLGAFAKAMHWPGAAIALTLGIFILVFVFTPTALINNFKKAAAKSTFFYWSVFLTAALLFVSALFKILHWPGAGVLLIIGTLFPFVVLIPALLFYSKKNKSFKMSNLIVVLLFLAYSGVSSTFLALNISKDMIDEAVTIQKEVNELNNLTMEVNREYKDNYKNSEFIVNSEKITNDINELTSAIINYPEKVNDSDLHSHPEKMLNKDNYGIAAQVISHHNPSLAEFTTNIINHKQLFANENQTGEKPIDTLSVKYNVFHNLSNSPKIWTIASLTAMKSQIEIQEHLYLKQKILNPPHTKDK